MPTPPPSPPDVFRHERLLLSIALTFGWLGAASLALQTQSLLAPFALASLSACAVALHIWLNRFAPRRDPLLLPAAMLLLAWGLLVLTRVAANFTLRQTVSIAVATAAFAAVTASRDRLRWLKRFKYTWLLTAFVLLLATLILGVNPSGGTARLWLSIGSFFLQPSEMLRLMMIAFWAAFLSDRMSRPQPTSLRNAIATLLPAVVMWLVAVGLLATQQDLGAASLLLLTFSVMLYLATGRKRAPLLLISAFIAAGAVGYGLSSRVATRVDIWLNPDIDPQGRSFQIVQSLIAIASGGIFGEGLNQGRPGYVPAVHTDFPFVAVSEEFGLIGAFVMLATYTVICARAWQLALRSGSPYVRLLAGGIAASLAIQVAVIIGGNLAMLPLTGVTLPFVSFGGSSLLAWMVSLGLLVRLSGDADGTPTLVRTAPDARAQRSAARLTLSLFAALTLGTSVVMLPRAAAYTNRSDNPRLVEDERAIARGAILAWDGTVLASSASTIAIDGRPVFSRTYALPDAAAAVGYYSQRYGAGGIEAFGDAQLRGSRNFAERLLHQPQIGTPITTTLDAALQSRAAQELTGRKGAAIVMDWRTGAVLAMASSPGFDPNTLDRDWDILRGDKDAPLVNRATQGLYQPGALLPWLYGVAPEAFAWDPGDRLQLGQPVPFELRNEAVPYPVTRTFSETIGQGALRVTPLRVAFTAARQANDLLGTPTLIITGVQDLRSVPMAVSPRSFDTAAQISADRFVTWHVRVTDRHVIVIALERNDDALSDGQRAADELAGPAR